MRMPNGYGNVVKLGGKRRRPYAVRVTIKEKDKDGTPYYRQKYVAYFETRDAAFRFQATLSPDMVFSDMKQYQEAPVFSELYDKWLSEKKHSAKGVSESYIKNLQIAYGMLDAIHDKRITAIKAAELQKIINSYSAKSRSTLGNIRAVLKGVFEYAIMNEFISQDKNPTQYLKYESTYKSVSIHSRFTYEEIKKLWDNLYVINNVDCVLIMIYTGLRPSEMLEILTENVHLDKHYMVGGLKTSNGYDRLIPLCDKIFPLVRRRYDPDAKYLINNKFGNHYTYATYVNGNWSTVMGKLKMNHSPHDCRYTFASMADDKRMNPVCEKIILGHVIPDKDMAEFKASHGSDLTKGVYTQKSMEQLLAEVNLL